MIVALLLAAQAAQPEGFTPAEKQAVAASMKCQKRYFDSIPPAERRRRGETLIEESYAACATEQATLRTILASRFNARATEQAMQLIRDTIREPTLRYLKR